MPVAPCVRSAAAAFGVTMDLALDLEPRTVMGRHVADLRRLGTIPAVLYGHLVAPAPLQCSRRTFERLYQRAGRARLVQIQVAGERTRRPVLIREVQVDPRSALVVHVDFFQVNLTERLTVDVPVVLTGEAPAVRLNLGELLHVVHTVQVSCLPSAIPGRLEVDVSHLAALDDEVRLREVALPEGVELVATVDPDELLVKVAASRVSAEPGEGEPAAATAPAEGAPAPA
ncbi:MAG TPA: 50S ribosomal protein L25 [Verrucomicrobiae bacterium]|nr:50S ribosomal protein L25 [Verrucomicrobiae bacterium]